MIQFSKVRRNSATEFRQPDNHQTAVDSVTLGEDDTAAQRGILSKGTRGTQVAWPHYIPSSSFRFDILRKAFVEGYFSTEAYHLDAVLSRHQQWLTPRTHSMRAAIDALGLLQLSTQVLEQPIATEACKYHGAMLRLFQEELNQPQIDYLAATASAQEVLLCQVSLVFGNINPDRRCRILM